MYIDRFFKVQNFEFQYFCRKMIIIIFFFFFGGGGYEYCYGYFFIGVSIKFKIANGNIFLGYAKISSMFLGTCMPDMPDIFGVNSRCWDRAYADAGSG